MILDQQSQTEVYATIRTLRIIVFALCNGILLFALYLLFLHERPSDASIGMLTYLCLGFAALQAVLCFVLPRFIASMQRSRIAAGTWTMQGQNVPSVETDAGKLAAVYQITTIVGGALLEGAAFFALVAYMIEGHFAALAAAAAMLIGVALHFPIGNQLSDWVERQLELIEEEKRFSAMK